MPKLPNEDLHGAELTQGSVMVLSFTGIILAVCVFLGFKLDAPALFFVGTAFFLAGILLCLPNLKNVIRGKIKEHRIRTGKEIPRQKKTWDPKHPFDH